MYMHGSRAALCCEVGIHCNVPQLGMGLASYMYIHVASFTFFWAFALDWHGYPIL